MGIEQSATDGSVELTPSAAPMDAPAPARPKRAAKAKATKPVASAASATPAALQTAPAAAEPPKKKPARKPAAKKEPAKTGPKKKERSSKAPKAGLNGEITAELIAIRAFLVWEKRAQQGLPGDEVSDWVEAERQLQAERSA